MKLWVKIALLNILIIVSLGIIIGLSVRNVVSGSLRQELSIQGESLARYLSASIADAILLRDIYTIQGIIDAMLQSEPTLEYIYVIDEHETVLAHTFFNGYPSTLLRWNELGEARIATQLLKTEKGYIRDVGLKVFPGMIPEVHVGINEQRILKTLDKIRVVVISSTVVAVILGSLLSFIFSRLTTKSLNDLVDYSHTISQKTFGNTPTTKVKDEVSDLSDTFKLLSSELESYRRKMEESYRQMLRTEKLTALGRISAGLAHEIRNPLTSILILFRTFRDDPCLTRQDMEVVLSAAEQMDETLTRFLRFARTDEFDPSEIYINPVIKELATITKHQAKTQSVDIALRLQKIPPFKGDRPLIKQVVMNLMLNALEAMPHGGRLEIMTKFQDETIFMLIRDTGSGIPKEIQEHVFDPFFTTKDEGTGLGLSIVYNIVQLHNGHISFKTSQEGTIFTMQIPVIS